MEIGLIAMCAAYHISYQMGELFVAIRGHHACCGYLFKRAEPFLNLTKFDALAIELDL